MRFVKNRLAKSDPHGDVHHSSGRRDVRRSGSVDRRPRHRVWVLDSRLSRSVDYDQEVASQEVVSRSTTELRMGSA